jgi:hypothetical protein
MSTEQPPAGWYPNPDGSGGVRWWSGVGWTEYTREWAGQPVPEPEAQSTPDWHEPEPAPADEAVNAWQQPDPNATQQLGADVTQNLGTAEPTQNLGTAEPTQNLGTTEPTQNLGTAEPTQAMPDQPANPWAQQPANPWAQQPANPWSAPAAPMGGYAPYQPPPKQPLTGSGMRPVGGMFSDIGRIVRRGWLPILVISAAIWAAVSAVYAVALAATVDLPALQRAFDLIGASAENNPETGLPATDPEISAAFRDAFAALSPSGWALMGALLTLLLLVASSIQTAAVNRVAMDAAAGQPVSWSAGWKSGFTAGLRLFGYYLLLSVVVGLAWILATVVVVALWAISPAIGVIAGLLGFLALVAATMWLTGRLIPVIVQVVVGRRAISWSWRHTKGKFWGVLGRYLLWALAASVIVNVVVTVLSIPVSLVFLGTAASTSSTSQLGASLVLTLITLPLSMALSAITFIGVVPIWRDLTDHSVYRSIDESGLPIVTQ